MDAKKNIRDYFEFQPTLPVRGATGRLVIDYKTVAFQPTLPVRGATAIKFIIILSLSNFNPRSP